MNKMLISLISGLCFYNSSALNYKFEKSVGFFFGFANNGLKKGPKVNFDNLPADFVTDKEIFQTNADSKINVFTGLQFNSSFLHHKKISLGFSSLVGYNAFKLKGDSRKTDSGISTFSFSWKSASPSISFLGNASFNLSNKSKLYLLAGVNWLVKKYTIKTNFEKILNAGGNSNGKTVDLLAADKADLYSKTKAGSAFAPVIGARLAKSFKKDFEIDMTFVYVFSKKMSAKVTNSEIFPDSHQKAKASAFLTLGLSKKI